MVSSTGRRLGRGEHRGVADRLDEPHRRPHGVLDELLEVATTAAELLRRDLLAQPREADDVDEADHDLLRVGQPPALQLGLADDCLPDLLAQPQVQHLGQARAGEGAELAQRLGVAQAEVALGVARAEQRELGTSR